MIRWQYAASSRRRAGFVDHPGPAGSSKWECGGNTAVVIIVSVVMGDGDGDFIGGGDQRNGMIARAEAVIERLAKTCASNTLFQVQ